MSDYRLYPGLLRALLLDSNPMVRELAQVSLDLMEYEPEDNSDWYENKIDDLESEVDELEHDLQERETLLDKIEAALDGEDALEVIKGLLK